MEVLRRHRGESEIGQRAAGLVVALLVRLLLVVYPLEDGLRIKGCRNGFKNRRVDAEMDLRIAEWKASRSYITRIDLRAFLPL